MTEQSPAEVIFFTALQKPTTQERAAYLDEACGGDGDLRRRVERLLSAHPQVGSFLEPAAAETASYSPTGEQAGAVVAGRYKLVEEIGEGGMGTVFMAQQTEPVKRLVAVKLIKAGMDSKAVLTRFEAERQALALMDHPNIAKVLDAGATPAGRPFFVMELVKGVPITRYCDDHMLTPRERLELFVPVCHAVQHAHQKGIIHRDLKPSNVLVTQYDGRPVPKVIDFGVAKATGQPLTEKTLVTGFGAMVGTPEYMSPEQTEFNQLDIDTRSDVYALGVLLYELLTGSTPFSRGELEKAGLLEILRVIREQEPPRPSVKLSTTDALPAIAAKRGSEPKTLAGLLRHELDWIVMKALEKDRNRRYETATAFASDVQRYLSGEAIQAHPPSRTYRLRKLVRKNRVALTTVVAFGVLLLVSAAVSGWLAVKARRAEAVAKEQRKEAVANKERANEHAERLLKSLFATTHARREVERTATSLQVDLDLAEIENEPRVGLLRLCRTNAKMMNESVDLIVSNIMDTAALSTDLNRLMDLSAEQTGLTEGERALREFMTAAILAAGQDHAPLLPPITHDGQNPMGCILSPTADRILTFDSDSAARLRDTRTGQVIAILRHGSEEVLNAGFSPDGRTVFTDDAGSVARLWDAATGEFLAETERRADRYKFPGITDTRSIVQSVLSSYWQQVVQLEGGRLLTRSFERTFAGPVELWDTQSGRLIARLDGPEHDIDKFEFAAGGKWITTIEDKSTVVVLSSEDGRLLARLPHGATESIPSLKVSPTGKRIVVRCVDGNGVGRTVAWNATSWESRDVPVRDAGDHGYGWFLSNDRFVVDDGAIGDRHMVEFADDGSPQVSYRVGFDTGARIKGDVVHMNPGILFDAKTGDRLSPQKGRRYHPELRRFAPDGRFVLVPVRNSPIDTQIYNLIDTVTEKELEFERHYLSSSSPSHLAGLGWVAVVQDWWSQQYRIRLLPTDLRDVPVGLLELWAQVAVRGELREDGQFHEWDEATWERKRQELAALPAEWPDFPFPGYVANDRLHWLRAEFQSADEADKPRLAKQLLERAGETRDKAEAFRWRSWLAANAPSTMPPAKDAPPAK